MIRDGGRYNAMGTGVVIGHASDCRVEHCKIADFFYSGVSVGWQWAYLPTAAMRNVVRFNRIHDLGKGVLSDMGGVYTLGTAFGTRVTDNVIFNASSRTYGGWGLYADEGTEGVVFERNLVYNTHDGGFHQHYGAGNTVRNNIFAWNEQNGVIRTIRANVFNVRSSLNDYDKTILSVFADAPERPEDVREVYLAPGAVLNARLKIRHPGVRLHGRGKVLDPMSDVFRYDQVQNPSRGLVAIHASGVTVEGVKLVFRDFRLVRP